MRQILLAGMLGLWATTAMAHSPLSASVPANEEIVAELPEQLLLAFKAKMRLTRLTMTHADHDSVDMDLSGAKGFVTQYAVPLQSMGSGIYVIDWRGLGDDGHAANGTFSFTVQ